MSNLQLSPSGLDNKIIDFIHILRSNGVRVSISEDIDIFRAFPDISLGERDIFKAGMRSMLVKSSYDIPAFDQLFDLYFAGMVDLFRKMTDDTQAKFFKDSAEFEEFLEKMRDMEGMEDFRNQLDELAKALMGNDTGQLEQLIRQAAERAGISEISNFLQEGYYSYKILQELGWEGSRRQLEQMRDLMIPNADLPGEPEMVQDYITQRIADFTSMVREYVRGELEKMNFDQRNRFREQSFEEKSFYALTEVEIERMREVIDQLAQKLKASISMRRKRRRRGKIDIQRTLRQNMKYGAVPFNIVMEERKKDKPQVVTLCDVSDSVRTVSKFMLQFVFALQDLYSRVRSYIFVADIGEITDLFRERDVYEALDLRALHQVVNLYANSNFGQSFLQFHQRHLSVINKKTTVIVLGDGRNNYNPAHDWVLRDIQQKAKKLVWLNPEPHRSWGLGDSEMPRYARYCDVVEEVRNLKQLRRAIDRLLPG